MVHHIRTPVGFCQLGHGNPRLLSSLPAVLNLRGKGNRSVGEAHVGTNALKPKDTKDVDEQRGIVSPADFPGGGCSSVIGIQVITDMRGGHLRACSADLREKPTVELQHFVAVGGRPFGKEDNGKPIVEGSLDPGAGLEGRASVAALDVDRTRHRRHPAEDRIAGNLCLGDEDAGIQSRVDHDIQVALVVGDDRAMLRKAANDFDLHIEPAQCGGGEAVQPLSTALARGGPADQKLKTKPHEIPEEHDAPLYRPKKTHLPLFLPHPGRQDALGQSILRDVNTGTTELRQAPAKGVFYRRFVQPLLALLNPETSPERLAWSIAAGLLIGINPLLGTATTLCFAVALALRLNLAASQLANYAVYPLQILLLVPFLRIGSIVFRTAPIPLSRSGLLAAARSHPLELMRGIWQWEWHALVIWAAFSTVLAPPIALALTPLLRRLQRSESEITEAA